MFAFLLLPGRAPFKSSFSAPMSLRLLGADAAQRAEGEPDAGAVPGPPRALGGAQGEMPLPGDPPHAAGAARLGVSLIECHTHVPQAGVLDTGIPVLVVFVRILVG